MVSAGVLGVAVFSPYVRRFSVMSVVYRDAIAALNSLQTNQASLEQWRAERYACPERSLQQTSSCLQRLGIDQGELGRLSVVHVAGTKGKGSTCAMTESLLRCRGHRTGLYSSPHLVAARERIRIDGRPLSEHQFASYFWQVYDALKCDRALNRNDDEPMPMYFMFLTVMSLYVFLRERVDVVILEVGIGGLYDCTNVVPRPAVCGITCLDYDHTEILGSRIEQIAEQKAGIIKAGAPVFVASQPHASSTLPVLAARAHSTQSPIFSAPQLLGYRDCHGGTPQLSLAGSCQQLNASLALQLARCWVGAADRAVSSQRQRDDDDLLIPEAEPFELTEAETSALLDCRWPGRCQLIDRGDVRYYLDGAHTVGSIAHTMDWFVQQDGLDGAVDVLVVYFSGSRDASTLLAPLASHSWSSVLFCTSTPRRQQDSGADHRNVAASADVQLRRCGEHAAAWRRLQRGAATSCQLACVADAVHHVERRIGRARVLVVGSLHLVGGFLSLIDPELSRPEDYIPVRTERVGKSASVGAECNPPADEMCCR